MSIVLFFFNTIISITYISLNKSLGVFWSYLLNRVCNSFCISIVTILCLHQLYNVNAAMSVGYAAHLVSSLIQSDANVRIRKEQNKNCSNANPFLIRWRMLQFSHGICRHYDHSRDPHAITPGRVSNQVNLTSHHDLFEPLLGLQRYCSENLDHDDSMRNQTLYYSREPRWAAFFRDVTMRHTAAGRTRTLGQLSRGSDTGAKRTRNYSQSSARDA